MGQMRRNIEASGKLHDSSNNHIYGHSAITCSDFIDHCLVQSHCK